MKLNNKNTEFESHMNIGNDSIDNELDKILVIQKKYIGGEIYDNC